MRRLTVTTLSILALMLTACPTTAGVLYAKIAVAGCRSATDVCQAGFDAAAKDKTMVCNDAVCKKLDPSGSKDYQACMKKDHKANPEWVTCYAPVKDAEAKWVLAKPMLLKAWDTADAAIKAEEQKKAGEPIDYMTPIKDGVCTLTKIAPLLPEAWQKKIKPIIDLAAGWACGDKTGRLLTPEQQIYVLKQMRRVTAEILHSRV